MQLMRMTHPQAMTRKTHSSLPAPVHWSLAFLLALTACALCALEKYYHLFSWYSAYDDEGALLVWLKAVHAGVPLYDRIFTVYGPFPFYFKSFILRLLGLSVGHDVGRSLCLAFMVATAFLGAWLVERLTRSLVATCVTAIIVLQAITPMVIDPGHPQEVCVVLLTVAPLLAFYATSPRRFDLAALGLGAIAGLLAMSKVNLGIFMLMALGATLLAVSKPSALTRWLWSLFAPALLFAVVILLRPRLNATWVQGFAAIAILALVLLLNVCYRAPRPALASVRHYVLAAAGFLGSASLVILYSLLRGTTFGGLFYGIIVVPLRSASVFTFAMPYLYRPWLVPAGIAVSFLAFNALANARLNELRAVVVGWALFRLIYALFLGALLLYRQRQFLEPAIPFAALVLLPPREQVQNEAAMFARILLAFLATTEALMAYPVAGSQMGPASLLAAVAAVVIAHDGWAALQSEVPAVGRASKHRLAVVGRLGALAIILLGQSHRTHNFLGYYRSRTPLDLPGAHYVRFNALDVAKFHRLTQTLRANADMFISHPSINSLYLWTEQEPPTDFNVPTWLNMLDAHQQRSIVERLSAARSPCVIIFPNLLDFWRAKEPEGGSPLLDFIRARFKTAMEIDGWRLLVLKDRSDVVSFDASGAPRQIAIKMAEGRESALPPDP
jgi:hypothetical protein